jgi:hypothetical protein
VNLGGDLVVEEAVEIHRGRTSTVYRGSVPREGLPSLTVIAKVSLREYDILDLRTEAELYAEQLGSLQGTIVLCFYGFYTAFKMKRTGHGADNRAAKQGQVHLRKWLSLSSSLTFGHAYKGVMRAFMHHCHIRTTSRMVVRVN